MVDLCGCVGSLCGSVNGLCGSVVVCKGSVVCTVYVDVLVVCAYVSVHGCVCRLVESVEVCDMWRHVVSVGSVWVVEDLWGLWGSLWEFVGVWGGDCGGLRGCASANMFVSVGQRKELI